MSKITVEEGLSKYERYMFYKALQLSKGNYHDAQDIVSCAIVEALEKRKEYELSDWRFIGWIKYKLLGAMSYYKNGNYTVTDAHDSRISIPIEEYDVFGVEGDESSLIDEISSMPFPKIAVYRYQGYTNIEIANMTGDSLDQVKDKVLKNKNAYAAINGSVSKDNGRFSIINKKETLDRIEYNYNTGGFKWKKNLSRSAKIGQTAGSLHKGGEFIVIKIKGEPYLAHRLAWAIHYDVWDFGEIIHINGDKTDNRIENLKEATA